MPRRTAWCGVLAGLVFVAARAPGAATESMLGTMAVSHRPDRGAPGDDGACQAREADGHEVGSQGQGAKVAYAFSWVETAIRRDGRWTRNGNASSARP
jgi:hypothetical protein